MDVKSITEFIKKETPQNVEKLNQIYSDLKELLESEQSYIKNKMHECVSIDEYSKVKEYIAIAEEFSKIIANLDRLEKECGLQQIQINNTKEDIHVLNTESTVVEDDEDLIPDKCVNYEEYRVDETIPHDIFTDFKHMKPAAFSLDGVKYPARLWKLMLLETCNLLYQKNPFVFSSFVDEKSMQGKSRTYFSNDNSGMTRPERVEGTSIYIETNLSANSIRDLIVKMLDQYRIPHNAYKIFLSKNLKPLHPDSDAPLDVVEDNTFIEMEDEESDNGIVQVFDMTEICSEYDEKTYKCLNENSPYFVMRCCYNKNCEYKKPVVDDESRSIKILVTKKYKLKKRVCKKCGDTLERTVFPVKCGQESVDRVLQGYWCDNCKSAYITEGTFQTALRWEPIRNVEFEEIL